MKRLFLGACSIGLACLASPRGAQAQSAHYGIGGGLLAPVSDYANVDNMGWHLLGKVDFRIPMSPLAVRLDALFGQTTHQSNVDGHTQLIGGLANLVWNIPSAAPMVKPYLLGGGGVYNVKITIPSFAIDTSETKFTWDVGAGATLGAGPARFFAEARYVSIQETNGSTKFIPITVGITFRGK